MTTNSLVYTLAFMLLGYLSGSVLYIRVAEKLFHKNLTASSSDHNPGAFNAFKNGGFFAGSLTVFGDIFKGILPVALYLHLMPSLVTDWGVTFVLAAPVFGHIYSCFNHFHGGKGIAVSFGVLLALIPDWAPVLVLAALFLFFSLVVIVRPDSVKTALVFVLLPVFSYMIRIPFSIVAGELLIAADVLARLYRENRQIGRVQIYPFWKSARFASSRQPETGE